MGIWNKVKETGKVIKDTAKEKAKSISDELARQAEERRNKEKLLSNFYLEDMKGICKQYGYSGPDPYEEDENGKRHKITLEREDWFRYCMTLSLDKLKKYAEKDRRISQDVRDTLIRIDEAQKESTISSQKETVYERPQEVSTIEKPLVETSQAVSIPSDFEEILSTIRTKYEDAIRDAFFTGEDQFNDHLVGYLRAKFEDKHRIEDTHKLHRDTGDIFIDGKYVLELKYADSIGTLDKGATEAKRYKEKGYPGVAIIILDIGKLTGSLPQYKRWYEEEGAKVIILRGKGERKSVKKRYFVREA